MAQVYLNCWVYPNYSIKFCLLSPNYPYVKLLLMTVTGLMYFDTFIEKSCKETQCGRNDLKSQYNGF